MLATPRALRLLTTTARRARAVARLATYGMDTEMSLAQALERWAKRQPDAACVVFEGRTLTYGEAQARVERRAAALYEAGVRKGEVVALMMSNRPEYIINAVALDRIGAVSALVNVHLRGAGLRHALLIAQPVAAIIGGGQVGPARQALADHPAELDLPIWVDRAGPPPAGEPPFGRDLRELEEQARRPAPRAAVRGGDLLAYIYTSGTTGLPKAGKVLHARVVLAAEGFGTAALGLGPGDVFYCCLPLFHSNGFIVATCGALWNGATLALARRFSASHFWQDIRQTKATAFVYIGEICRYLLSRPPDPGDRQHAVRRIIGNGLRPEVWNEFVERFRPGRVFEFYGATEGNVNMINLTGRPGSVGKIPAPLDNTLLVRFDPESQEPLRDEHGFCIPCKPGEVGELLGRISNRLVGHRFDGYADAEATERKILRNVRKDGDAYFRSGDLLRKDERGYFYFVDRVGDTFRWKGENVSTNEVGVVLHRFPGVELANVYGVRVPGRDGRAGMVTLVLHDGVSFDPKGFFAHAQRELPSYARPAFVRVADEAHLTATLKLKKTDLVRDGFDPAVVGDPLFYRDDDGRCYRPLDGEAYEHILRGDVRF